MTIIEPFVKRVKAAERAFSIANKALWATKKSYASKRLKKAWDAAHAEASEARAALESARAFLRPNANKCRDSLTHVYLTKSGQLVMVHIGRDGIITLFDDDISPVEIDKIGEFGADGRSDYNWGVVGILLDRKLTKSPSYRRAQRINRDGL